MKLVLKIVLILSLVLNVCFLYRFYISYKFKVQTEGLFKVENISLNEGSSYLFSRLKNEHPSLLPKKYFFISIWNIACAPCIKEMPILDSLAGNVNRKDIGFIFLTENGNKLISDFLKRKKISSKHFVYINDADTYTSSVFTYKGLKNRGYPIQLVINRTGEIKYFSGEVIKSTRDSSLINFIKKLP